MWRLPIIREDKEFRSKQSGALRRVQPAVRAPAVEDSAVDGRERRAHMRRCVRAHFCELRAAHLVRFRGDSDGDGANEDEDE